jgi:hypothetical protein
MSNVVISALKGARIQYADVISTGFKVSAGSGQGIMVGPGVRGSLK